MLKYVVKLGDGLITVQSPLATPPGAVIGSENYECRLEGGYRRIAGYERFDGRPSPSQAVYVVLGATSWDAAAVVGETLTGDTSAATGIIAYIDATTVAVCKVTGTFEAGETVSVGATPVASSITLEPTTTAAQGNAMHAGAAAILRADIEEVPGSGPVCGVCVINDEVFAFRDNAGGTKQVVWKATSAGWVNIDYPTTYIVGFDTGSGSYDGGALTLTQGGNTAAMHRMHINSGSLAGGDAEGFLILRGASAPGAFTSGAVSGTGFSATLKSGATYGYHEYTMRPGGRWQFRPYAFGDPGLIASGIVPVYGVDRTEDGGGGNFIEFDGLCVAPIFWSQFTTRYPERIEAHKNHLFIAIHSSLWFSGLGNPASWTVFTGGGEIVIGQKITELSSLQGSEDQGALLVCCQDKTQVIYGNSSADWNMVPLSRQVGALPYTMQQIGGATLAMDQQGVRDFRPTQDFGNFAYNTLTDALRNKVTDRTPVASLIDRTGGHYRVYFDDGTWLSGAPGKRWRWMLCQYPITVHYAGEWEIAGAPRMFMTDANPEPASGGGEFELIPGTGFVYEVDAGRSFDGAVIPAWFKTAYCDVGLHGERKAFRRAEIEVRSQTTGSVQMQPDYSYGASAIDQPGLAVVENGALTGTDGAFDLGNWDLGTWDAQYMTELRCVAPGVGENVSMLVYTAKNDEAPHDMTAVTHYFLKRRQGR